MVSLKELTKSSQISSIQLEKIRQNIYCLDYDAWFKVSQNGEIILTKKILLEALQQVSKSRDEKFFSEHFSYIAKDFDPSQPSQYLTQSLKDYKDWLVGLNKDRILQSNIEQLKIDCQNGLAGEGINLQNFLAKSELESNLLTDINNYFRDNLFMTKNSSDPKSNGTLKKIGISEIIEKLQTLNSLSSDSKKLETYQVSCDHKFGDFPMKTIIQVVKSNDREYSLFNNMVYESRTKDLSNSQYLSTYEEFLKKIDEDIELAKEKIYKNELKTEKIIDLLRQLNDLSNTSQNLEVTRNSNNTVEVKTKNSYFSLDKSTQKVLYCSETRKESSNYSFDDFINELNKSIKKEDKNISSQIYQAPTSHPALLKFDAGSVMLPASGQENDNSTSQKYMSYVGQPLQPTLQQPAMSYVGQTLQAIPQPQYAIPQPHQAIPQPHQAIPQPQTQRQYQQFTMQDSQPWQAIPQQPQQAVLQGRSLSTQQPVYYNSATTIQQTTPVNYSGTLTLPMIKGRGCITYPISMLNFSTSVIHSALPCGVGGGTNHRPSQFNDFSQQGYQHQGFATPQPIMQYSQPMPYPQRPGLMVYQPMQVSQPTILSQGQMLGFGSGITHR
jgi:hypothetical protein